MKHKNLLNIVKEVVELPIEIGDTVMMGKFKNKKVVVKTIGWSEKGDLLINGKSAMRMRLPKKTNVDENKGLWHNIRAKRARGEKPAPKGSEAHKDAVKAAKKINAEEYVSFNENEYKALVKLSEYLKTQKIEEAEYQGRKVKLNKPMQGDTKKFKVYVKNPKGNVVKVNFGHKGKGGEKTMRIRKSNPDARKNFRARHNCDSPGPRHKARYWSCRKW